MLRKNRFKWLGLPRAGLLAIGQFLRLHILPIDGKPEKIPVVVVPYRGDGCLSAECLNQGKQGVGMAHDEYGPARILTPDPLGQALVVGGVVDQRLPPYPVAQGCGSQEGAPGIGAEDLRYVLVCQQRVQVHGPAQAHGGKPGVLAVGIAEVFFRMPDQIHGGGLCSCIERRYDAGNT
jgi:hypothetical protein